MSCNAWRSWGDMDCSFWRNLSRKTLRSSGVALLNSALMNLPRSMRSSTDMLAIMRGSGGSGSSADAKPDKPSSKKVISTFFIMVCLYFNGV